jgi:hypothetical protein
VSYSIDPEEAIFITDSASANIVAFKDVASLPCLAHVLNLVVEAGLRTETLREWDYSNSLTEILENTDVMDVHGLVGSCSRLVAYFKRAKLQPILKDKGLQKLTQRQKTRWSSVYFMLESISNSLMGVTEVLQGKQKLGSFTCVLNEEKISELIKFLKPMMLATMKLQEVAENHLGCAILALNGVYKHLFQYRSDWASLDECRKNMLTAWESKVLFKFICIVNSIIVKNI